MNAIRQVIIFLTISLSLGNAITAFAGDKWRRPLSRRSQGQKLGKQWVSSNADPSRISHPGRNVWGFQHMAEDFVIPTAITKVDIVAFPKTRRLEMISIECLTQLAVTRTGDHKQWHP